MSKFKVGDKVKVISDYITNDIYKIYDIEIRDGDLTKLIKINNGDLTIFSDTNVIVTYKEATENIPTVECYRWKSKEESFYFNNNSEKVIYKVRFHSYPWKGTGFA